MARGQLFINGVEKSFNRLSVDYFVKAIPTWNVDLLEIDPDIQGFQICNILRDGDEIFRGYVTQPEKGITPAGQDMPVGGLEWTGRLKFFLTPHSSMTDTTVTTALETILQNSPYLLGTVDSFEFMTDPFIWDTTLEFLEFTWTDLCIVYGTTAEVQSEISTDNLELPDPPKRSCFWYDGTTKRFYIIAYNLARGGGAALQYNFTADGLTWNGWADFAGVGPAVGEGAAGTYGVANITGVTLTLLVDDGANIDHYTGTITDGTGVITTALTAGNVDAGDLVLGPKFDDDGHIWMCIDDGVNWAFWEWTGAAWFNQFNKAQADQRDPKEMFAEGYDGDIVVIMYDIANADVDEWRWDRSGAAFAFERKIADIDHNSMGYACGYQDPSYNIYLYWEDIYAAGDADIEYSERPHVYADTALVRSVTSSWITKEEAVDDDQYQTPGNFSVSGDGAGNTYLFYEYQTVATGPNLHVIRRLEGSFGSSVELAEQINDTGIDSPETNLAVLVIWLDLGLDGQFILLAPYGITAVRDYEDPTYHIDFDVGDTHTGTSISAGCSVSLTDTSRPFSCTKNLKATIPAGATDDSAAIYKSLGGSWGDIIYLAARNVRWDEDLDTNGQAFRIMGSGEVSYGLVPAWFGVRMNAGLIQWHSYYRDAAGWNQAHSGVEAFKNTDYFIEAVIYRHGANGFITMWVNGVQVISQTGLNNLEATRELMYAIFGLPTSDAPLGAPLTLTMDDCRISTERIGDYVDGTVRTDLYTASGGFLRWGTLSSPDDDDCNTSWSIYDDIGPTLQLSGLITSVDLDEAGLSSAITDIYVQASYTHRYKDWRYIYTIQLSERAEDIDLDTDYENCYVGVNKAAGFLSSEFRLRWDDTLDFLIALGEDKSDRIILKTAKSLSVRPEIKPNITIVRRAPDYQAFANAVKLLGAGDWPDRIEAEAQDATSQETYGVTVWKRVVNKDAVTEGMAQTAAQTEVDNSKNPIERISVSFLDEYDTGEIAEGVTVYLADENTDLLNTARIVRLSREYNGAGDERVTAELTARLRGAEYVNQFLKTYDLERWI